MNVLEHYKAIDGDRKIADEKRIEELEKSYSWKAYAALEESIEGYKTRIAELEAKIPKEGEWIELTDRAERTFSHVCSNCHRFHINEDEIEYFHYCPNCGAKMRGERNEQ